MHKYWHHKNSDRRSGNPPGLLAGYLETEALPNSLELIPPPPEDGSAAMALDAEVSRKALKIEGYFPLESGD